MSACDGPVMTHPRSFLAVYEDANNWQTEVYGTSKLVAFCTLCGRKGPYMRPDNTFAAGLRRVTKAEAEKILADIAVRRQQEWDIRSAASQAKFAGEREQRDADRRQYLRSDAWAELRRAILRRDKWLCQGCLKATATQVHHLTYANLYNELCFQLVSLCADCHRKVHGIPE